MHALHPGRSERRDTLIRNGENDVQPGVSLECSDGDIEWALRNIETAVRAFEQAGHGTVRIGGPPANWTLRPVQAEQTRPRCKR